MTERALAPVSDGEAERLRHAFARDGGVQIAPFLHDGEAVQLRDHLRARDDWQLAVRAGGRVLTFDAAGRREFGDDRVAALKRAAGPRTDGDFTYSYERITVRSDRGGAVEAGAPLADLDAAMNAPAALALFRRITGCDRIDLADAKATRFGPGDFLSLHHDRVDGSDRVAAYVLGLTEDWRAEHGGLLLFHGPRGDIEHGYVPAMNVLNLFAVPRGHSVSMVAPFAPGPRLAVTGWLRQPLR